MFGWWLDKLQNQDIIIVENVVRLKFNVRWSLNMKKTMPLQMTKINVNLKNALEH
jgi:hypothetical protein